MDSETNALAEVWRALVKRRTPFAALEAWGLRLTPSDRLVVGMLGFVMFLSAGAMLAEASQAFTIDIPAPGGAYTEGIVGSPRFVNPLLAISETDQDLVALVYSGLMRRNPDGKLSLDLAESYAVSDDGLTYTFTLRGDAEFQNGTAVTADDIAFTVHAAQNPAIKSPSRANWEGVVVTAVDPRTVSFTLKTPYAPFTENASIGVLPHELWQDVSPDEFPFSILNTSPIGSGPYHIENVRLSSSGIPVEYRLSAFRKGVRIPFIERIVLKFYQDSDALADALISGQVDAAHSVPLKTASGDRTVEAVLGRVFAVFFNQNQNKVFADKTVRAALDAAVDKQAIVDTVVGGYGSVIDGPLPPDSVRAEVPYSRSPENRIDAARAMLATAGWKLGDDGVFLKKTKSETTRLSFSLSTASVPELKRAAEMVAADWQKLGAEVELKFFDQNDLNTEVLRPRKYDALLFGLVVGSDVDLFAFWHSSQRNDPGLNVAEYANIDVDKKLETARTEPQLGARREIALSAAEIIRTETAAIFLYTPHFIYLVPKNLSGVTLGTIVTPSDRFLNVDKWYIARERIWPFFATKNN
jgi:peptide/nickel transport system substrate-binding protein